MEEVEFLAPDTGDGLLSPAAWRQAGERLTVCFDLQRGIQVLNFQ